MRVLGIRGLVCLTLAFTLPFSLAPSINSVLAETIVPGGTVSGTWTAFGSPYLVQGNITVPTDSTLTIEPGVAVRFQGSYGLTVNGLLDAAGTEADSIRFTATSFWSGVSFTNPIAVSHVSYASLAGPAGSLLACSNSSPDISHCRISGGSGIQGGVYVANSGNPSLTHSTISSNGRGIWWNSAANGVISDCVIASNSYRGVLAGYASQLTFVGCSFSDNTYSGDGGAAYTSGTGLNFLGCTFTNNQTTTSTGRGGAVFCTHAQATFTDCTFSGNTCIYQSGQGGGAVSLYYSGATFTRCTLFENWTYAAGGAIAATQSSSYILDHCTVDDNFGDQGMLYSDGGSSAEIKNSIISNGTGAEEGITAYGPLAVHHTGFFNNGDDDVHGTIPPGFGELVQTNPNGDSCDVYYNIFMDPLYEDQAGGDYHLQAESPCIDAGDPAYPLDPDGTVTDMGAFPFTQGTDVPGIVWPITLEPGLSAARPNPFSGRTEFYYTLHAATPVHIAVFDIQGRLATTLLDGMGEAGTHRVVWDGTGEAGVAAMPGIYFVRLEAEGSADMKKVLLLR